MQLRQNSQFLLLHGWGLSYKIWDSFTLQFIAADKLSAPCLYQCAMQADSATFAAIADSLNQQLIKESYVIIAWSIGGHIATHLSSINKKISAIIFIASTPLFINKLGWGNVIDDNDIEHLHSQLLSKPQSAVTKFSSLIARGDQKVKTTCKFLQHYIVYEQQQLKILSFWLQQLQSSDLRRQFAAIKVPVLVILGEHDQLIKSAISTQLVQLNSNIACKVLSGCGHVPFVSKREETQSIINGFLHTHLS